MFFKEKLLLILKKKILYNEICKYDWNLLSIIQNYIGEAGVSQVCKTNFYQLFNNYIGGFDQNKC